ncbi:MAG: M1 family aminopeptidase, partial [Bacillota bacterium]
TSANTQFGDPFYTQSADYRVRLWVPEAYQVAASGEILSIEAEDNGWQNLLINASKARDFALAVVFNYHEYSVTVDGVRVAGFFNGKHPVTETQVMEQAAAAIKYFSCTYGSYARPQLVLVQGPMKGFRGMEYSGLIFLAEEVFSPDYDEEQRAFLLAHEIAHQWWYDMVGNNQLKEPWLDEGLANWSARQYLKTVEHRSVENRPGKQVINLEQGLTDMGSKSNYLDTAYQGGENFWYQLEEELGEEKVLQVLRSYLANYRFRTATTEDLRQIISRQSRNSLDSFFERWFTTR